MKGSETGVEARGDRSVDGRNCNDKEPNVRT